MRHEQFRSFDKINIATFGLSLSIIIKEIVVPLVLDPALN